VTTLSADESILRHADRARPQEYARDLASRMVTSSRESHDFGALSRWGRRYAELQLLEDAAAAADEG